MPCLAALFALVAPRAVIVLLVVFSDYIGDAYDGVLLPFLGFCFMPVTTLAYAYAQHSGGLSGLPLVLFIVALLMDFGIIGNADKERRKRA
jgi:hypothetical protein